MDGPLREHRTRSKNRRFVCDFCSLEKYKCQKCYFKSDLKVLLTKHYDTLHKAEATGQYINPVLRNCENCDFQTYSSLVLLSHYNCCDGNEKTPLEDTKVKSEYEECATVQNVVTRLLAKDTLEEETRLPQPKHEEIEPVTNAHLKVHINVKHTPTEKTKWFTCYYCTYKAKAKPHLHQHLFSVHNVERKHTLIPPEQIHWFKCDQCSYKATSTGDLKAHVYKRHTSALPQKILKCDHCSYKTVGPDRLRLHMGRLHTPSEQISWIKCEHCLFLAKEKGDLSRHMIALHSESVEVKKLQHFECDQCSFKTVKKEYLKRHVRRRHTNKTN